jgi:hypothetical protein
MSKALTTSVFAAVAAFALNGCLGGGMVVDASEPPSTDTETDTDGTEPVELVAAAKTVPVRDAVFER